MFKTLLKTVIALSTVLWIGGCESSQKPQTYTIGTNNWPGYEPLHLAEERGYFQKPVMVNTYKSATEVLNLFRTGKLHLAAITLDEAVMLRDQGYEPVVIAILDISDGADVIMAGPGIKTLADLRGKTIGVENSALGSYILARALEIGGLTLQDVNVFPVGHNRHEEVFTKNVVDAVITFEPVRSALVKKGANEIFTSKEMPGEIVDVLVIKRGYFEQTIIDDLLQGWSRSTSAINDREADAVKRTAQRLQQTPGEFIASLDGLKIPTLDESNMMLTDGTMEKTLEKIQKVMLEKGLIKEEFDVKTMLKR
ncbi:MAG: ABC transporter substrate-binding protein [Sulfurimonadaceae bacterium]|nr:ABC transporter substrate-binding protein [Sulfurimonadaceae bacterium]